MQARDRKRHGDAMIAMTVDMAAARLPWATLPRGARPQPSVGQQFALDAERAQASAMTASRSLSLTRSSAAPRHEGLALGGGGGNEEDRKLIDRQRHQGFRHADALAAHWRAHGCRRSVPRPPRCAARPRCRRPSAAAAQQPGARRIDADTAQGQARGGPQTAGHDEERRRREVPRHLDRAATQALATEQADAARPRAPAARRNRSACARYDRAWEPAR